MGAGIAGASCATALASSGVAVSVLDRGRAPGGRMASPLIDGRRVDIGASYFTCADPEFGEIVEGWQGGGLCRPWTDRFDVYSASDTEHPGRADAPRGRTPGCAPGKPGPTRWAAPGGLRTLVRDLLTDLPVHTDSPVQRIEPQAGLLALNGLRADRIVLAMPDPQALQILQASEGMGELPVAVDYEPVLAVTMTWSQRHWPFQDGAFVNDHPVLAFLADDGSRRGDLAAVLVAHTTASFAQLHLTDPDRAIPPVVAAVTELLGGVAQPKSSHVHRWSYGKPTAAHGDAPYWLGAAGVGVAGDSWCPQGSPRVESAWLSGRRLAEGILR